MTVYVAPELKPPEPPPEARQLGAWVWLRKNLFSTWYNSLLTVVLGLAIVAGARGAFAFLLSPDRLWGVIPPNATNYAVDVYPRPELTRIWVVLAVVMTLVGFSAATWRPTGKTSWGTVLAVIRATGAAVFAVGLLVPGFFGGRVPLLVAGAVLILIGAAGIRAAGERAREENLPILGVVAGVLVLAVAVIWLLPVAETTKVPWTVEALVLVAAYLVGRPVVRAVGEKVLKVVLSFLWVLSLPVIYLHLERKPIIPWETVISWLPWVLPILAVGYLAIVYNSRAGREQAAAVNAVLVVATLGTWTVPAPMAARLLLLLLVGFTLAAPTFASSEKGRRNFLVGWTGAAFFLVYFVTLSVAETGLETQGDFLGGLNLTFLLALGGMLLSFPIGIMMALGRTSTMPIFRLLSTGYIEVVRGVPLITVLFFADKVVPRFLPPGLDFDGVVKAIIAIALFSGAYLAENIRGGLQSIPKGQYEAARALGMTTAQMTMLITLPQALRAVIPAIVGQVISLFKDTSLVAIIGLADFFRVARDIVPNQPTALGSQIENLVMAAVVYWIFTFSFSRASLRLERKLGVGTR